MCECALQRVERRHNSAVGFPRQTECVKLHSSRGQRLSRAGYQWLQGARTFLDGYCSTVQGLLDWFEVDLGFTELLFIQIDLCVMCVFVLYKVRDLRVCGAEPWKLAGM